MPARLEWRVQSSDLSLEKPVQPARLGRAGLFWVIGLLDLVQVGDDVGDLRVAGPVGGLLDGERALQGRAGGGHLTQLSLDGTQVAQDAGDLGMVRPVSGLLDGQRAFYAGVRSGQVTLLSLDGAQVGENGGDFGMLGPEGGLLDG